jgi:hypothetical protein
MKFKNRMSILVQDPRYNNRENRTYLNSLQKEIGDAVANHRNFLTTKALQKLRPHGNDIYNHIKRLINKRDVIPLI